MESKNAIITSASIRIDRGSFLCVYVYLKYNSGQQGFGGNVLYKEGSNQDLTGFYIDRILSIAGVEDFKDLKGKTVRVKATNDKVIAVGHIVNDDWLNISEDLEDRLNKMIKI